MQPQMHQGKDTNKIYGMIEIFNANLKGILEIGIDEDTTTSFDREPRLQQ